MKVGDLVKYIDLYGNLAFGVVSSEVFTHTAFDYDGTDLGGNAVRVAWMDDGEETVELLEVLLDEKEISIQLA